MSSERERRGRRDRLTATRAGVLLLLAVLLTVLGSLGTIWGKFSSATSNTGNKVTGAADWVAPTASASVIQKTQGGTPGYIHQGGTYRVYANDSDTGNPASGIASVTGNVSSVTSGQTAAPMSSGSFAVFGQSYNYDTASLTAASSLAAGTYSYTVTSTDSAGNSRNQSYSVVVDNTAPTGTSATSANGGSTQFRAEPGDTITLTYSDVIDPNSIVSGWTGSSPTNCVVRLNDGLSSNDTVSFYAPGNSTQLPLGSINLGRVDYNQSLATVTYGASGTASTIAVSGNSFVITLGTQSGTSHTAGGTGTVQWTTSSPTGATDRAGNALSASTVSTTGARWF
jgi:hypothetical protein